MAAPLLSAYRRPLGLRLMQPLDRASARHVHYSRPVAKWPRKIGRSATMGSAERAHTHRQIGHRSSPSSYDAIP